jgi:hypothetical protein
VELIFFFFLIFSDLLHKVARVPVERQRRILPECSRQVNKFFLIESKTLMIFYYIFVGAKEESDLTLFVIIVFKETTETFYEHRFY